MGRCTICGEPAKARGMCKKHWRRWKKYGDPTFTKYRDRDRPPEGCRECGGPTKMHRRFCSRRCANRFHWKQRGNTRVKVTCTGCGGRFERPAITHQKLRANGGEPFCSKPCWLAWRGYRPWTDAEDQYLRENYADRTRAQLAATLKRRKNAVAHRLHDLGLRRAPRWTVDELEAVRANGRATTDELRQLIPRLAGRSLPGAQYARAKAGVRKNRVRLTLLPAKLALVEAAYRQGMNDEEIAAFTNVNRVAVGRWRRTNGLPANGWTEWSHASAARRRQESGNPGIRAIAAKRRENMEMQFAAVAKQLEERHGSGTEGHSDGVHGGLEGRTVARPEPHGADARPVGRGLGRT